MARAKKEAALTPEERLQAALVPDWEWPYKLPENWCWVRLYSLAHIISKGTTPKGGKDAYVEKGIRFLRIENINEDGSISHENIKHITEEMHTGFLRRSILCKDDILISIAGTLGKTGIVGEADLPLNTNQAISFVRLIRGNLLPQYIKMSIDNPKTQDMLISQTKVTSIPNLTLEIIGNCAIPLAPLAEQQRIVDRIESLFAKLDEAKEKAQAVVDSFETRKAAILHKAFTGELTAKWREEHGIGMESWHIRKVGEICENVKVGIVIKPSQYYVPQNEGTPAFRSANVRECKIDDFDWVYINEKGMAENNRSVVHTNDVLVVRSGNPGTACVVPERFDGYNAIDILIAVPNREIIISEYLCYYTNSPFGKKSVASGKRGSALTHFNVKGYSQMLINIPSVQEQAQIVYILDELFAKEQQTKESAKTVLDQIDLMKKSILARAFRGELGTNDPTEESAVELLKKIIR